MTQKDLEKTNRFNQEIFNALRNPSPSKAKLNISGIKSFRRINNYSYLFLKISDKTLSISSIICLEILGKIAAICVNLDNTRISGCYVLFILAPAVGSFSGPLSLPFEPSA